MLFVCQMVLANYLVMKQDAAIGDFERFPTYSRGLK
jgi:hypothetical protein